MNKWLRIHYVNEYGSVVGLMTCITNYNTFERVMQRFGVIDSSIVKTEYLDDYGTLLSKTEHLEE